MINMPIRFNEIEATAIFILAQYHRLPLKIKREYINQLRKSFRPIGQLLCGMNPDFTTPEIVKVVNKLKKWSYNNTHYRKDK
jgi:hypothetical protein